MPKLKCLKDIIGHSTIYFMFSSILLFQLCTILCRYMLPVFHTIGTWDWSRRYSKFFHFFNWHVGIYWVDFKLLFFRSSGSVFWLKIFGPPVFIYSVLRIRPNVPKPTEGVVKMNRTYITTCCHPYKNDIVVYWSLVYCSLICHCKICAPNLMCTKSVAMACNKAILLAKSK